VGESEILNGGKAHNSNKKGRKERDKNDQWKSEEADLPCSAHVSSQPREGLHVGGGGETWEGYHRHRPFPGLGKARSALYKRKGRFPEEGGRVGIE